MINISSLVYVPLSSKLSELGARFFGSSRLRFCASGRNPLALALSNSVLDHRFRPFAFALSRSHGPYFSRWCVYPYIQPELCRQPGQDSQNRIARTGQPIQDSQDGKARTGRTEQGRQNRTVRTGKAVQDRQNRTGRLGLLDRTAWKGLPDKAAKTGMPRQESPDGAAGIRPPRAWPKGSDSQNRIGQTEQEM
jgi:hypothetical protein